MILQTMKRALEALEMILPQNLYKEQFKAKLELRAAIEQMEKAEPVAIAGGDYPENVLWHGDITAGTKLYTHPAPVPADWRLVPVEPTPAMKYAGWGINIFGRRRKYKTMLAAAPKEKS